MGKIRTDNFKAENVICEMAALLNAYPAPEKWTAEQRSLAAWFVVLAQEKIIAGVDFAVEKEAFLASCKKRTSNAYRAALDRLGKWVVSHSFNFLNLTLDQACDFIDNLKNEKANKREQLIADRMKSTGESRSTIEQELAIKKKWIAEKLAAGKRLTKGEQNIVNADKRERLAVSINRDISALISFYNWLHSRYPIASNPFFKCDRLPKEASIKNFYEHLCERQVKYMIEHLPPNLAAAVAVMAYHGLKSGELVSITVDGDNKFTYCSRGRDITVKPHSVALDAIKKPSLPKYKPFADELTDNLRKRIERAVKEMCNVEGIGLRDRPMFNYSCEDFRRFFTVTEWNKENDISRISELLNHANVSVTKDYLRRLGLITELSRVDSVEDDLEVNKFWDAIDDFGFGSNELDDFGL